MPQDKTILKALKTVSMASPLVTEVEDKSSKAYKPTNAKDTFNQSVKPGGQPWESIRRDNMTLST